jgi:proteasome accessory factor B
MAKESSKRQLVRQWRLLEMLSGRKFGRSVKDLMEACGVSRPTLYRDFEVLEQAGVPISSEMRNGEAWYRLESEGPPSLRPTPAQHLALTLARTFLRPLEGTRLVEEYDALLGRWSRAPQAALPVSAAQAAGAGDPEVIRAIEEALSAGRQLRFFYEGASGPPSVRLVDPLGLRMGRDNHLYLDAFDTEKKGLRTYKPPRMSQVEVTEQRAAKHPEYEESEPFAYSLKTWSAPPVEVEIVLSPRKARFLREWPLSEQQEAFPQADGSVRVKAVVAGLAEVSKWVLSWGRDATVLSPPELRQALQEELTAALATYAPPE